MPIPFNTAAYPQTCVPCLPTCPSPFDRVIVRFRINGGTRVAWELVRTFTDLAPLTFQLQVGTTANPNADDWKNVGLPVVDAYMAVDGEKRVYGKSNWTHYRIKLTTSEGVYFSDPVNVVGTLSQADWRVVHELTRQQSLNFRRVGRRGYLLKRRITGVRCRECTDSLTGEVRKSNCPSCYSTGFQCGYYYPMGCVYAELSPRSTRKEMDGGSSRGWVEDVVVQARMLLNTMPATDDVFVCAQTDERFYIRRVSGTAEWKGVPIVGNIELAPIPFSSIVYAIDIPESQNILTPF